MMTSGSDATGGSSLSSSGRVPLELCRQISQQRFDVEALEITYPYQLFARASTPPVTKDQ